MAAAPAPDAATGTGTGIGIGESSSGVLKSLTPFQFVIALSFAVSRIVQIADVISCHLMHTCMGTGAGAGASARAATAGADNRVREAFGWIVGTCVGAFVCSHLIPDELFAISNIKFPGVDLASTKLVVGAVAGFVSPFSHQLVVLAFHPNAGLLAKIKSRIQ